MNRPCEGGKQQPLSQAAVAPCPGGDLDRSLNCPGGVIDNIKGRSQMSKAEKYSDYFFGGSGSGNVMCLS